MNENKNKNKNNNKRFECLECFKQFDKSNLRNVYGGMCRSCYENMATSPSDEELEDLIFYYGPGDYKSKRWEELDEFNIANWANAIREREEDTKFEAELAKEKASNKNNN